MAEFIRTQNSFANGAVAPEFYANDNLNGLSSLQNMDVLSSGAISRRAGLVSVDKLSGPGRLFSFSVSSDEEYLIVLTDYHMDIYLKDNRISGLNTPWSYLDLCHIQCAQRFDTMIFVHSDYPPQTLQKNSDGFVLSEFSFAINEYDLTTNAPFVRFDDTAGITIKVESHETGTNAAKFTTNRDFWTPENILGTFMLLGHQWIILEYISPKQVIAVTNGGYSLPSSPVSDWQEIAFSRTRGWPRSITFHQDRLVFGGTRSWAGGIWLSQVGRHNNFNSGTGLDDEAIFISLQSQQRQQICTVVSADNLQILTTTGEWAISCKPLTPSSVDIRQHTSVGSYSAYCLAPQQIEGTTIFVAGNGCDIRELSLDNLSETYSANDLCALSKHLILSPIDISYNASLRRLYIVNQDGSMAVLNRNSSLGISAWGTYQTKGSFLSVCVCGGKTYAIVLRETDVCLEYFDSSAMQDADEYSFSFTASGLPVRASGHDISRIRLRKISARVLDTKSIHINNHRISLPNDVYKADASGYSGDVSVNLLGTSSETIKSVWTVHGTEPYPVTILSITLHGWYTV